MVGGIDNNLGGLGIEKITEEFMLGRHGSCRALNANIGNDAGNAAAFFDGVLGLDACESGFDDFDARSGEIVLRAQGDQSAAAVEHVSNKLKRGGAHEAVRI